MEGAAVHLAVKLTPREVAAVRAALVHVQHDPAGLSELARLELESGFRLTDGEIESLVNVLGRAAEVIVLAASGAAVKMEDRPLQLLREAFDVLNDPESKIDLRDWNREAKKFLRPDPEGVVS